MDRRDQVRHKQHGNDYAEFLQKHYPSLYLEGTKGLGCVVIGMRLSVYWDSHQNGCGSERIGIRKELSPRYFFTEKAYLCTRYTVYVLEHYAALFSAAIRIFGSWRNALVAAGIEAPDRPHDGRRGVLRALRDALEQHQSDLPEKLKYTLLITSVACRRPTVR